MQTNEWFETTVALDQMQDDGMTKSVTQKYLVNAISFTEAEDRIVKEVSPFTSGNLDVKAVRKCRIADLFPSTEERADVWFRVRVALITIDEKTQEEKETMITVMVQSTTFDEALKAFHNGMKGSLMDYRVVKLEETKILDVFLYEKSVAETKTD